MKFTVDTLLRDFLTSLSDQTPATIPALTLGDNFPVSFEFGKDGAIDESIGALDTVEVALSSCVTPDRGTFRLFPPGGPITGDPITLPATTSAKALASAIAASWDGVSLSDLCVTGASGFFRVEFQGSLADTEIDAMTGDGTKLSPRSVVSVNQKTPGGGGQNAVQIISLDSVPLAYADDLTFDDGVFSGILNVDTVAANEAMREAGKGRVSRLLSVRVTDDEGNRTTYAKRPVIVDCTGIPMGPFGGGVLAQYLTLQQGDGRYPRIIDGRLETAGEIRRIDDDGRLYPEHERPGLLRRTAIHLPTDGIPNLCYNQWVNVVAEFDGTYYGSACGRPAVETPGGININGNAVEYAPISSWQMKDRGLAEVVVNAFVNRSGFTRPSVSEHISAAPSLNLIPGARYPLAFFQNEHNNEDVFGTQMIRSRTLDVKDVEEPKVIAPEENRLTYTQAFRNPFNTSDIVIICRQGGVNGTWNLLHSLDDGDTWEFHPLATGAYILARPQRNDRGLWLAFHRHPTHTEAGMQRLLLMEFRFVDGSLRIPGHGVVVPSVYEATTYYDAFDDENALVIRTPEEGKSTRLYDLLDTDDDGIEIVLAEFNRVSSQGDTYDGESREYRHVRMLKSNWTVATDTVIPMDPGWPYEENTGANYYFSGVVLVSSYRVVAANWLPTGETVPNHQDHVGESNISEWSSVDSGDNWTETLISTETDKKIIQPQMSIRYAWRRDNARQIFYPGSIVCYAVGKFVSITEWETDKKIVRLK